MTLSTLDHTSGYIYGYCLQVCHPPQPPPAGSTPQAVIRQWGGFGGGLGDQSREVKAVCGGGAPASVACTAGGNLDLAQGDVAGVAKCVAILF